MARIGIITVFYSENFGSVLQAYALRKAIEAMGHEAVYVSTRNKYSSHSIKKTFLSVANALLHLDPQKAKLSVRRYFKLERTLKSFNYIKPGEAKECLDAIVLGSDTVWDVDSLYFNESPELFWPRDFKKQKLIAYAPSVANSTAQKMQGLKYPKETLAAMSCISVRDRHSLEVISQLTDKSIELVCDPTILMDKAEYQKLLTPVKESGYIAVYAFEPLSKAHIAELRAFAKEKRLKLISVGKNLGWCHSYTEPSVEAFLSYISGADYVVTNTFHGTVFSVIFEKQFVLVGRSKMKVVEFLKDVGLEGRIVDQSKPVTDNLLPPVGYTDVNEKLSAMKARSRAYLQKGLSAN